MLGIGRAVIIAPVAAIGAQRHRLARRRGDTRRRGLRKEPADQRLGQFGAPAIAALSAGFGNEEAEARLGRKDHVRMEVAGIAAMADEARSGLAHDEEAVRHARSEEHTSEPQSLIRTSYAVFSLKK